MRSRRGVQSAESIFETMTGSQLRLFSYRACLTSSIIASVLITFVNAATYTVGDDTGTWGIPATTNDLNYSNWSDGRNFRFGDELVFRYANNTHNVLLVNASEYDTCFLEEPIALYSSGYDTVALNLPGRRDYYFICGTPTNCWLGQKLHVSLVGLVTESQEVPKDDSPAPPRSDASPSPSGRGPFSLAALSAAVLFVFLSSTLK